MEKFLFIVAFESVKNDAESIRASVISAVEKDSSSKWAVGDLDQLADSVDVVDAVTWLQ